MTKEPVKKRIIGIDPGYAITGYGIIDKVGSKFEVVDYGVIETKAGVDFPLRLLAINDKIRFLLEQFKPDFMSIEELFMGHNHTTVIGTAQARGAVLVEAGRAGVEKKQVQIMTKSILGLKEIPKPDDAADALALAITLANTGIAFAGKAVSGYQYGRYGYSNRNQGFV